MKSEKRADNVLERPKFFDYVLMPTDYKFDKVVHIHAIVIKFIRSFKCVRDKLHTNTKVNKMYTASLFPFLPSSKNLLSCKQLLKQKRIMTKVKKPKKVMKNGSRLLMKKTQRKCQ